VKGTIGIGSDELHGMKSDDIARYIEHTDSLAKPWLLIQWRIKKLQEQRSDMDPEVYLQELSTLHQSLMDLGEWWVGQEDEVF
jgi:hypothetical protein